MSDIQSTQLCYGRELGLRTVADALNKLRELGSFGAATAEIKAQLLRLPSGDVTTIITFLGTANQDGIRWAVGMPSAAEFWGISTSRERQRYETHRLDGAIVDELGNVNLIEGLYLHGIKFIPTKMPFTLSDEERSVVLLTLRCFPKKRRRYYRIDVPALRKMKWLDFRCPPNLSDVPLKEIEYRLREKSCKASRQTIATALSKAGMRLVERRVQSAVN